MPSSSESQARSPLPSLLDTQEIDLLRLQQHAAENPPPPPRPDPLVVVRAKFPHIADRLQTFWGKPECDALLARVIVDDRGGRAGFPPDVMAALLELSEKHQAAFGFAKPDRIVWSDSVVGRRPKG